MLSAASCVLRRNNGVNFGHQTTNAQTRVADERASAATAAPTKVPRDDLQTPTARNPEAFC